MSASPTIAASSTKRPLEEPSSPAGPNEQPDAKRPALDKMVKEEEHVGAIIAPAAPVKAESVPAEDMKVEEKKEPVAENGAAEPSLPTEHITVVDNSVTPTHPIQSMSANPRASSHQNQQQEEAHHLHLRAVISTTEAATIIGKGGENVTLIRQRSGARCTVSDFSRGATERILTVSGPVDAVSKVGTCASLCLYLC